MARRGCNVTHGAYDTRIRVKLPAGWTFAALLAGLALGWALSGGPARSSAAAIAGPVGTVWLRALQMTIVPLVAALLVIGIAQMVATARAGPVARRTLLRSSRFSRGHACSPLSRCPRCSSRSRSRAAPPPRWRPSSARRSRCRASARSSNRSSPTMWSPRRRDGDAAAGRVLRRAGRGDHPPARAAARRCCSAVRGARQRHAGDHRLGAVARAGRRVRAGAGVGLASGGGAFAALAHYILLVAALGPVVLVAGYALADRRAAHRPAALRPRDAAVAGGGDLHPELARQPAGDAAVVPHCSACARRPPTSCCRWPWRCSARPGR